MSRQLVTVAVSGLNAIDSPGPGVAVIRCLKESTQFDVRVIGLAYENLEPGIYMPGLVEKTYQVPYPSAGTEELFDRLMHIHQQERLDAVIPNFDAELSGYIKLRQRLESKGITVFTPTEEQFEARSKSFLPEFGKKYGISVPASENVATLDQLRDACSSIGYPLFVKGRFYEAYKAYSYEQAASFYHKIAVKWGAPVIVQEIIEGEEFNICAIGDGAGNTIGMVPMKKLFITDAGKAWAGITVEDEGLSSLARTMIKATKWRGPLEIEMMRTAESKAVVIEINPRFPAWVYLTKIAGQNQPETLIRKVFGMDTPVDPSYLIGKMFIRYSYDLEVDLDQFQMFAAIGELNGIENTK